MIFTSLDLELNKEGNQTTDIIQIGAVIGNIYTGEILKKLRLYVKPSKPLDPFIITLTGIKQSDIDEKGITLLEAYNELKKCHIDLKSHHSIIQWGGGDEKELKEQLLKQGMPFYDWCFGRTYFNVKSLCQSISKAKKQKFQGGLKKYCQRHKVIFEGPAHDALQDSLNTFKLYVDLLKKLEKI